MCSETVADAMSDGSGTVFAPKVTKARKAFECQDCGKRVQPGRYRVKLSGVYEGDFWSSDICGSCDIQRRWLERNGHGWMVGIIAKDYDYCRFGDHTEMPDHAEF